MTTHIIGTREEWLAARLSLRSFAMQELTFPGFFPINMRPCSRDHVLESAGQQVLAHLGEIVVPAQLGPQLRGSVSVGRHHEFDILQVIVGSAGGNLGQLIAHAVQCGEVELVESCEEMVVPRSFAGSPVPHRPCIHQLVIENMIAVSTLNCRFIGVLRARGIAGRSQKIRGAAIYAKVVACRIVDPALCVDGATHVIVQVAALGHLLEKGKQQGRILADRIEVASCAFLGRFRHDGRGT